MRDGMSVKIKNFLRNNAVTLMFVILCVVCMAYSGQGIDYVMFELMSRLTRNAFLVLALIIPIVAGMGINFAITIGAMAAQISILWVLEWGIPGIQGLLVAALMTVPIASLFGFLIGKLLNKMKGQEMIGSMILGYFANGLYQLLFLFIFGNLIPMNNPSLVIKGSTGIANTMDLSKPDGMKYALDGIWRVKLEPALYVVMGLLAVIAIAQLIISKGKKWKSAVAQIVIAAAVIAALQFDAVKAMLAMTSVPVVTFLIVGLLCVFNIIIMRTKLGQQFRAVGQNMVVANASGINVNKIRVIAIMFSTVLAGWGQIIFVQNMGSLQTYGAHEQVGLYAGAAILVGGASMKRASNAQAILGCILFHALFIVAPPAGKNLFGNAAIGEYFRVFISYGVIALALVLHTMNERAEQRNLRVQSQRAEKAAKAGV